MYAIAERFPEEARRYAASLTYSAQSLGGKWARASGAAGEKMCPLGACFEQQGIKPSRAPFTYCPLPEEVANGLSLRGSDEWGAIAREASEFIGDFDDGKIDDLYDALGVEP